MSTNNFAFENRCVIVSDDDYTFGNVPSHEKYVKGSNRNYSSFYIDKYRNHFCTVDIVLTSAYYSGACIDYTENDTYLDGIGLYDEKNEEKATDNIMEDFKAYNPDRNVVGLLVKQATNAAWGDYTAHDKLQNYLFSLEKPEADRVIDSIMAYYGYTEVRKISSFCNGEATLRTNSLIRQAQ